MKKHICFLLIILFLFSSCSPSPKPEAEDSSSRVPVGSDASSSQILEENISTAEHEETSSAAEQSEIEQTAPEEMHQESTPYVICRNNAGVAPSVGDVTVDLAGGGVITCDYCFLWMCEQVSCYGDCLFPVRFYPELDNYLFQKPVSPANCRIMYDFLIENGLEVRMFENDTLVLGYVTPDQLDTLPSFPSPLKQIFVRYSPASPYLWRVPDEPYLYESYYLKTPYDSEDLNSLTQIALKRYFVRPYTEEDYAKQAEMAAGLLFDGKEVQHEGNCWTAVSEGNDSLPVTETIEVSGDGLHYRKEGGKPISGKLMPNKAISAFDPKEIQLIMDYCSHTVSQPRLMDHIGMTESVFLFPFNEVLYTDEDPETGTIEIHLHQKLLSRADDLGMYLRLDEDGEVLEVICRFGEIIQEESCQTSVTQVFQWYSGEAVLYERHNRNSDLTGNPVLQEIMKQYEAQTIWDQDACFFYSTLPSSGPTEDGLLVYEPTFLISESDQEIPYYYMIDEFTSRADKAFVRKNDPSERMRSLLWPSLYNRRLGERMLEKYKND